jgi:hypothetical protein
MDREDTYIECVWEHRRRIARGDMECWSLTIRVAYTPGSYHDGDVRRHIIHDFNHWNQPLLMKFHIKTLLQGRLNQFGMEKIAAEFKDARKYNYM